MMARSGRRHSAAAPNRLQHNGKLLDGNIHAAHNAHDLGILYLGLFLLQFPEPGLKLGYFSLDLFNFGLNLCGLCNCHIFFYLRVL